MSDAILVLNAGSSSIKFSLFRSGERPSRTDLVCEGQCEGIGHHLRFTVKDGGGTAMADESPGAGASHEDALNALLDWLKNQFGNETLAAAGHRVVHGGARYSEPIRIDDAVIAELHRLIPLAPLHQPHHLEAIAVLAKLYPTLPQVACFDTAFHHDQAEVVTTFALPRALTAEGIRRYGFHGLSCEYIAGMLPEVIGPMADGRIVLAHLGSGASLCAMHRRRSVATTMGFTALDGLVMSRRCGDLDPGVVLYLMQEKGMTATEVGHLLYEQSGLLGVSGISDDMRTLLASADAHSEEAIALFVYRIGRELGSLVAALGGLDALVFTAGIGEHAPEIRRRVCEQAAWLGVRIDGASNTAGGPRITTADSVVSAWVIPTDEDLMIARHAWHVIGNHAVP